MDRIVVPAKRMLGAALALAGFALVATGAARAQSPEESYYKGKTVRIVVGYGPGGGYDVYARMIAPYLGKSLGTSVVVENQPGAGGITALNRIMTAAPDGVSARQLKDVHLRVD